MSKHVDTLKKSPAHEFYAFARSSHSPTLHSDSIKSIIQQLRDDAARMTIEIAGIRMDKAHSAARDNTLPSEKMEFTLTKTYADEYGPARSETMPFDGDHCFTQGMANMADALETRIHVAEEQKKTPTLTFPEFVWLAQEAFHDAIRDQIPPRLRAAYPDAGAQIEEHFHFLSGNPMVQDHPDKYDQVRYAPSEFDRKILPIFIEAPEVQEAMEQHPPKRSHSR